MRVCVCVCAVRACLPALSPPRQPPQLLFLLYHIQITYSWLYFCVLLLAIAGIAVGHMLNSVPIALAGTLAGYAWTFPLFFVIDYYKLKVLVNTPKNLLLFATVVVNLSLLIWVKTVSQVALETILVEILTSAIAVVIVFIDICEVPFTTKLVFLMGAIPSYGFHVIPYYTRNIISFTSFSCDVHVQVHGYSSFVMNTQTGDAESKDVVAFSVFPIITYTYTAAVLLSITKLQLNYDIMQGLPVYMTSFSVKDGDDEEEGGGGKKEKRGQKDRHSVVPINGTGTAKEVWSDGTREREADEHEEESHLFTLRNRQVRKGEDNPDDRRVRKMVKLHVIAFHKRLEENNMDKLVGKWLRRCRCKETIQMVLLTVLTLGSWGGLAYSSLYIWPQTTTC